MTQMRAAKKMTMCWTALMAGLLAVVVANDANAAKFMTMKDAIKHFMPAGTQPFKVTKTVSDDKYAALQKRFHLEETAEFKDTFKKGPYTIFMAKDASGKPQMYIMILEQTVKTWYHKFAVGITPDGRVKEVLIIELNNKDAYPINKKSFLKQFRGRQAEPGAPVGIQIGKDVDIVTGATWSSDTTAIVVRRALALFEAFFSS
jgi:Na+-translocating ferredoxin:NAD+ oxidoreductase RnfG subunit